MKSLAIINPQAGQGKAARTWPFWKAVMTQAIGPFDERFTEYPGHGEALTRQALNDGYGHIHAVGGDGTANEVVSGFFQQGKAHHPGALFSVWPAGTACDFHRGLSLGESFSNEQREPISSVDIGHLTCRDHQGQLREKYFLNIASCGISGYVDQLMAKSGKKLGARLGFLLSTVQGLFLYRNRKVHIKSNLGDLGESLIRLAVVANGKYFGGGMKIAPDARIDDGHFQCVVLGNIGIADALLHTPHLYFGKHMNHSKISSYNVTWIEFNSDVEVLIDLDGEAFGTLPMRIQVIPSSLLLKTYQATQHS